MVTFDSLLTMLWQVFLFIFASGSHVWMEVNRMLTLQNPHAVPPLYQQMTVQQGSTPGASWCHKPSELPLTAVCGLGAIKPLLGQAWLLVPCLVCDSLSLIKGKYSKCGNCGIHGLERKTASTVRAMEKQPMSGGQPWARPLWHHWDPSAFESTAPQ